MVEGKALMDYQKRERKQKQVSDEEEEKVHDDNVKEGHDPIDIDDLLSLRVLPLRGLLEAGGVWVCVGVVEVDLSKVAPTFELNGRVYKVEYKGLQRVVQLQVSLKEKGKSKVGRSGAKPCQDPCETSKTREVVRTNETRLSGGYNKRFLAQTIGQNPWMGSWAWQCGYRGGSRRTFPRLLNELKGKYLGTSY
ncbi:hypothetical protein RJT34_17238 [Clitoria ternatea]|uniref:Uncharacterized protein n=1 Tax=Clitoria ternatea TaxID=43366 RepID=A0AAN9PED4_CLITE